MAVHDSDIIRKLRLIESLKAEIVTDVGHVYDAIARNQSDEIGERLAITILSCYVLGRRLGFDFAVMEELLMARTEKEIKRGGDLERLFGDYSEYRCHAARKQRSKE